MKKVAQCLMGIMLAVCLGQAFAAEPLTPEKAFQVTVAVTGQHEMLVSWKIAPDYFLYAGKLHFTLNPEAPLKTSLPATTTKQDAVLGAVQTYTGSFTVPVQVESNDTAFTFVVAYQGCSKEGFCYPPTKKSFDINFTQAFGNDTAANHIVTNQSISELVTDQYGVQSILAHDQHGFLLLIFLGLGILLAFTPCVLPMLPILTGIIAGQKKASSTFQAFLLSSCYVLGMALTYALAGIIAAYAGGSVQVFLQQPAVVIGSSLLFILLGFSLFEFFDLPFSTRWQNAVSRWSMRHEGGTFIGVFLMGVLSTLVVSPCVTAPLVGVLLYISQTGDALLGGTALFFMGIGMGIPLMMIGISAGHWLPKSGKWMVAVTKSFGMVMFGMAIWLLGRVLAAKVMMLLWGLYLLVVALFFGVYLSKLLGRRKINLTVGFALGLSGLLMIASTLGLPLLVTKGVGDVTAADNVALMDFAVVHSIDGLQAKIAEASHAGRPVMVDFYADWCTSCVVMDTKVFTDKKVQSLLAAFNLVRVDLSANTADDQALLQKYNVIAPPTVLFFNNTGQEIDSRRIVGEVNTNEFLNRIQSFWAAGCTKRAQC